jgi:hypothetical protein
MASPVAAQAAKSGNMEADAMAVLKKAGVSNYALVLAAHGFTDLETLIDPDVLDDSTLLQNIKMTKMDIRKFRGLLQKDGAVLSAKVASKYAKENAKDGKGGGKGGKGGKEDPMAYGESQQAKLDQVGDDPDLEGGRAARENTKAGEALSSSSLEVVLRKAGLGKFLAPLAERGIDSVDLLAGCTDGWLKTDISLSKMDLRKLRAVVPAAAVLVAGVGADGVESLDGGRAAREQAKVAEAVGAVGAASADGDALATVLRKTGQGKFVEPLVANGITTVAMLADVSNDWLVAELKLSKMDMRKLRAVIPATVDDTSELAIAVDNSDDSVGAAELEAKQAGQQSSAPEDAAASADTSKTALAKVLTKAGLSNLAESLSAAGITTIEELTATDDDSLRTTFGVTKMHIRKLRASISSQGPVLTTGDIDGSTMGTVI